MEKGITVKELLKMCQEELRNGNGDKHVLISRDDEGNGFHTLFYGFSSDPKTIKMYADDFHDKNNPDEVVLLG